MLAFHPNIERERNSTKDAFVKKRVSMPFGNWYNIEEVEKEL